ncbi:class I SAM-dependent methyltransferase [Candidatus Parcubacteria bacterium]|nr:MAG: class I SAM-dependent methyltransferase [Candidatus Parcubacteria bacterium]
MVETVKALIKNYMLFLVEPARLLLHPSYLPRYLEKRKLSSMPPSDRFKYYYEKGIWKNDESNSGPGSRLKTTVNLRNELPSLLQKYKISTMLDIPCGDFHWMQHVDLRFVQYTGADVVEKIIEANSKSFASKPASFCTIDLLKDPIPRHDLILCRDCLVHFSFKDISKAIRNIKSSGSKFLFTTTFNFKKPKMNYDILTGEWRPINLELPPFNFLPPIFLIRENNDHAGKNDKCMGLWRISDLP